jgi:hypothetical protein
MTAGVSVPKPVQILATLRDRLGARNAVNAVAWPCYVHTRSARQARLRTRARSKQRRRRGDRFGPTLPADRGRATSTAEIAVGDDELDSIIRLLGDALDDVLSGTRLK